MIDCANTSALNKMLDSQEKQEKAKEDLDDELFEILRIIEISIKNAKDIAKDYQGYDFTEDIEQEIKDLV